MYESLILLSLDQIGVAILCQLNQAMLQETVQATNPGIPTTWHSTYIPPNIDSKAGVALSGQIVIEFSATVADENVGAAMFDADESLPSLLVRRTTLLLSAPHMGVPHDDAGKNADRVLWFVRDLV